jgi:hypothetical protein
MEAAMHMAAAMSLAPARSKIVRRCEIAPRVVLTFTNVSLWLSSGSVRRKNLAMGGSMSEMFHLAVVRGC